MSFTDQPPSIHESGAQAPEPVVIPQQSTSPEDTGSDMADPRGVRVPGTYPTEAELLATRGQRVAERVRGYLRKSSMFRPTSEEPSSNDTGE